MIDNGDQVVIAREGAVQYGVVVATISRLTAGKQINVYTVVYQDENGKEVEREFREFDVCDSRYITDNAEFLKKRGGGEWARNKAREVTTEPKTEAQPEMVPTAEAIEAHNALHAKAPAAAITLSDEDNPL